MNKWLDFALTTIYIALMAIVFCICLITYRECQEKKEVEKQLTDLHYGTRQFKQASSGGGD